MADFICGACDRTEFFCLQCNVICKELCLVFLVSYKSILAGSFMCLTQIKLIN